MPIYEYRCARCSEVFEALIRSAADEKGQKCPKCGCAKHEKLLSVFAAQGTASRASSSSGCGGCTSTNCSPCGR